MDVKALAVVADRHAKRTHVLLSQTNTKDKLCKSAQYTIKLILWLVQNNKLHATRELAQRWTALAKTLSTTRKVLWLGRLLGTVEDLQCAAAKKDPKERLFCIAQCLISITNDLADDCLTLESLGVVAKGAMPVWLERLSDTLYFADTVVNLWLSSRALLALYAKRQQVQALLRQQQSVGMTTEVDAVHELARVQQALFLKWVGHAKLMADLGTSASRALDLPTPELGMIAFGLVSAYLGTFKIFYSAP